MTFRKTAGTLIPAAGLILIFVNGCIFVPPVREADPEPSLYWCPPLPNCTSTESWIPYLHRTDSFPLKVSPKDAWPAVIASVEEMERTDIKVVRPGYVYAHSFSRVFQFLDFFEVLLIPEEKRLAVRSSAMLGITDFHVNYRRVHRFRDALIEKGIIADQD